MNNKTKLSILAAVIIFGGVTYGFKSGLLGSCSVKPAATTESCCSEDTAPTEKTGECCSTKDN